MSIPKVLIVDDEPRNVALLEAVLATTGVESDSAENGATAVEMFGNDRYDLVLLDVMMPGMDGFATLAALRAATPPGEHVPVVLITALSGRDDRLRGLEAGADDFLTKPIDAQEVRCRVRLFLHLHEMQRSLKRHAQELEAEKAARAELTSLIVHDLKNPLQSISANVSWAVGELTEPTPSLPQIAEALSDVSRATSRLVSLISTLLAVEQAESGQLAITRADTSLAPLLHDLVREHQRESVHHRITIEVEVAPDLQASIDAELVTRVLENLLLNALRYAGGGGRVCVEAVAVGDALEIKVANTGRGIAPEQHARLFQKYATTEAGSPAGNLGLGLYFSRLVCEAHGGTIAADATAAWATRMTVRIPQAIVTAAG